MANSEKEGGQCSVKKVYELVLSAREVSQQLGGALEHLIKLSLHSHDHFSFLLHRVNWFEPPLTHYRS